MTDYITKLFENPQDVKVINMSQNEIRNIPRLEHFKYLTAIDLSFNNIQTVQCLEPLKSLSKSLISISLHGNPVCVAFFTAQQYVQCLMKLLPNLTTIDSQAVNPQDYLKCEFFSSKRNYLCCLEGYDLVEFFVETFFTTWNNQSDKLRRIVDIFYHKKASLNFAFDFNANFLDSSKYELNIRKNLKLSKKSKNCTDLQIFDFYKQFYNTTVLFDISTFAIDLAVFNVSMKLYFCFKG